MEIVITHYEALKNFLATHLAREQANGSRTNAREKLTRLTKQQFQELSTDVYDELTRRLLDSSDGIAIPFLPVRDEFHPKRNQARQKLATLPKNKFKDLASDVYYELERRYPELKDMDFSKQGPSRSPPLNNGATSGQAAKSNTIIPETGTLIEETIPVDYQIQNPNIRPEISGGITNSEGIQRSNMQSSNSNNFGNYPPLPDGMPPEYGSPKSPISRTQSSTSSVSDYGRRYMNGMSVSSISSSSSRDTRSRDTTSSQRSNKPDTVNFASLDSLMGELGDMIDLNKSPNGNASPIQTQVPSFNQPGRNEGYTEAEKIKSDYELRIATLQKHINGLESELSARGSFDGDNGRIRDLEDKLEEQREVNKEQAEKLAQLEQKYDKLNEDHQQQQEVTNDAQKELASLLEEIKLLSMKNDELYSGKEQDVAKIKSLTAEVNEWKSKYEKTKIELRNLKTTSSFFKEAPRIDVKDSSLAPTPDGAIDESKITAYQMAIDDLLRAGRSGVPADVLMAMKSIVIACKGITEEVETYEQRKGTSMKSEDKEKLHSTKTKLSATLTNLMTAAKNHATGYGISPVSLVDAAASHLTASVVELVKFVKLRRAGGHDPNKLGSELPLLKSSNNSPNGSPIPSHKTVTNQNSPGSLTSRHRSNSNAENANSHQAVNINELKDFLERQTESIVQAIQTLLSAIRNGSFGNELNDHINTIMTIVLNVIAVCRNAFGSSSGAPYRERGDFLLKELDKSVDKLEEMRESIAKNEDFITNKVSKQRLAGAAFEIAKFTKELVGLIE